MNWVRVLLVLTMLVGGPVWTGCKSKTPAPTKLSKNEFGLPMPLDKQPAKKSPEKDAKSAAATARARPQYRSSMLPRATDSVIIPGEKPRPGQETVASPEMQAKK
jgi:hypothetical protein